MIEAVKLWNEPNNQSHWDFHIDPRWEQFSAMAGGAARRIKALAPTLPIVLGGMSPIDASWLRLVASHGLVDLVDVVAVHGFPLDWNHWKIDQWPARIAEIERETSKPVWVTEVGVSTFGADEVQEFGLRRTTELLADRVDRVFWYSLLDLPPAWEATTRHRESEGSSYYRHFYMGLLRDDRTPKPAAAHFDPRMGICQWFHYEDHRLDFAVEWLKRLGVRKLRTGLSWADWHRPNAVAWFDRQMAALADFDVTVTLCFTPPSRGVREHHTSPPRDPGEFADFAEAMVRRYVLGERGAETTGPDAGATEPAAVEGAAAAETVVVSRDVVEAAP
jgi:beta-xylosidase